MDEFVIGFMSDDPDGLTPIDIVMDVTGLTYEEVKSCCEIVTIKEPDYEMPIVDAAFNGIYLLVVC